MIREKNGITDRRHLIKTMVEYSNGSESDANYLIDNNIEHCLEVWDDDVILGYGIVMRVNGLRSIHGYQCGRRHNKLFVKYAMKFTELYPDAYISTTKNNRAVIKLAEHSGFVAIGYAGDAVMLWRMPQ